MTQEQVAGPEFEPTPVRVSQAIRDAAAAAAVWPPRARGAIPSSPTPTLEISASAMERHRIASINQDANADAFRLLRTQLLLHMQRNGWRTLAVTSPNRGAGKSTVALNLAISFAVEVDSTAMLVDADLREPDLRNLLEIGPGPGLSDYLVGRVPLQQLFVHPDLGNLVVLPGGAPVKFTAELLHSPMMTSLVRDLSSHYPNRITVFDVPPVPQGADALALCTLVDATILLVEERRTSRHDIERACELLLDANLIGIVLNKSRELSSPEPDHRPKPPGPLRRLLRGT